MIKVDNRRAIKNLSQKSLRANRARNTVAVLAIILTTLMFSSVFTVGGAVLNSFQQQTFRQTGGDFHGTFKDLTEQQMELLSADEAIVKSGRRLMLGMPYDPPFNKAHVEVSYMDAAYAKGGFNTPTTGALPAEGTMEIACDTRVLALLGVEPQIGAKLTMPFYLEDGFTMQYVEDEFTLSGWWEYDKAGMSSSVAVPLSYAREVLAEHRLEDEGHSGKWSLNVYFKNASHIDRDLEAVLERAGYQSDDPRADNYIGSGSNWGYAGAQLSGNKDIGNILALAALLCLIALTGYLIIYNIFQISVTNDIRFYGLLKTIGATGKQIKLMIRRQALLLSGVGIPLGLVAGWFAGALLAPTVIGTLDVGVAAVSASPLIFAGAALFSFATVLLSCAKPGRMAAKVSPVEAVRYSEGGGPKWKTRRARSKVGVARMAAANLGRSRIKTVIVVISLALSVVLLMVTYSFAKGFDMDKYLRNKATSDFIFGNATYFQTGYGQFNEDKALPQSDIDVIEGREEFLIGGRVIADSGNARQLITESQFYDEYSDWNTPDTIAEFIKYFDRSPDGRVYDNVDLYGMDDFPLSHISVVEGDLEAITEGGKNAIAAVYFTGDYGELRPDSNWAKLGDTVTIRYTDELEYYDSRTGAVAPKEQIDPDNIMSRTTKSHSVTYTVTAIVTLKHPMSYRYYGSSQFLMSSEDYIRDSGRADVMAYMFDVKPDKSDSMKAFLNDYTTLIEQETDYESKQSYVDEFSSMRDMFLLTGFALSAIIWLVGVLNFFNALLTSILTRRREFAMMQSIGMTSRQLIQMLVFEGLIYASLSIAAALAAGLLVIPLAGRAISSILWFYTYHFSIAPVLWAAPVFLILGAALPLVSYRLSSGRTIVERLRDAF